MAFAVELTSTVPDEPGLVVTPVFSGQVDDPALVALGFEGKPGETAVLPGKVAVGLGDAKDVTNERLRRAAAAAVRAAWRATAVTFNLMGAVPADGDRVGAAQAITEGALLASYRFTRYKTDPKPCRIERAALVGRGSRIAAAVERGATVAKAVALARDLVNEPPGEVTPTRLAEVATEIASDKPELTCEVLDEAAIEREGLGGLRGVSMGSAQPPRLIRLTYEPARPRATVAVVGKGITFDSGGLSLKTAQGMMTMKCDMSGAAEVIALMSILPALKPSVRVVGIAPATENLPGGRAIKPSDVLRIRNGKTVEVLNTDAEGRLVLADGLSLAAEGEPDAIVDLATLTGACVVALGTRIAGLMGNDDTWMGEVRAAADRAGEPVWPLPLPDDYRKDIDSDVADIKNIGDPSGAGALAGGMFLKEFVGDIPWVHLDIAGPAWMDRDDGYLSKGGTAFGIRTLVELLTSGTIRRRPGRRNGAAPLKGATPAAVKSAAPAPVKSAAPVKAAAPVKSAAKKVARKAAARKAPRRKAPARAR